MAQPYLPRWYIQQKKSLPSSFCIFNFLPTARCGVLALWRAVEISAATPTAQRCTNNPSISNSDFQSTPPLGVPLSSTSSKIRQRYYFAVVEYDSSATADYLYKACDGLGFGGEDAYPLDLRFIPNSVEFKHQPRDVAEEHKNLLLSWDEDDPHRARTLKQKFNAEQLEGWRALLLLDDKIPFANKQQKERRNPSELLFSGFLERTCQVPEFMHVTDLQFNKNTVEKEARKTAKDALKVQIEERKVKAMEEMAANEKREIERKEKETDMQIMSINLSEIQDPRQKAYYNMMKNQIMDKLMGSANVEAYYPQYSNSNEDGE
ncbi:hypothetical protein Dimus_018976 [Dionaea muscipula]